MIWALAELTLRRAHDQTYLLQLNSDLGVVYDGSLPSEDSDYVDRRHQYFPYFDYFPD